ncbi:MAG: hypothetical protein K9J49_07735 [Candidatus Methylopumilus sp.]|nr:hypothetical protein [Candidatus Methylopumilus sp.]
MAYKFEAKSSGYGMFTIGSKVEVFGGLSQSLFLGNRSSSTIGFSNSFNLGPRTDFSMGPTVSFNYSPEGWELDKSITVGARAARRYARYDFSNNKIFAFQVSPEGSSTYATTSKFNCTQGFQVVGGLSTGGHAAFETYSALITKMGRLALISNAIMALGNLAAFGPPEANSTSANKNEGAIAALGVIPGVLNMGLVYAALSKAISVAAHREDVFKTLIRAESVLQLTKELVFLGSAGADPLPDAINVVPHVPPSGAGLQLRDGKATLSSRNIITIPKPFTKKSSDAVTDATPWGLKDTDYPGGPYIDFADKQTAAIEVVPQQITAYGQTIKIAAGYVPGSAPIEVMPLPKAAIVVPADPPSLLLTAAGPTAKIQAETLGSFDVIAGSFDVIAPTISLKNTKTPPGSELVISAVDGVTLNHSSGSNISISKTGDIEIKHLDKSTSITMKTGTIELASGLNSINLDATTGIVFKVGVKKFQVTTNYMGSGMLKVLG